MRQQGAWGTAALVIVACLSSFANAHLHRHRAANNAIYCPGGDCSAFYASCLAGCSCYGPPACNPCAYPSGYRPSGACGGHGCCLHRKIHNHHAARKARNNQLNRCFDAAYAANFGCCSSGAMSWNCDLQGCAGCGSVGTSGGCGDSSGTIDLPAGARIISDRVLGEEPTPAEPRQSSVGNRSLFRLTGLQQNDGAGLAAFERGIAAFRKSSMNDAVNAFTTATEAEPSNAIYHYYRALAMFDGSGAEAAQDALATAVEVERREGVENWGKRMERVQGRGRLWIENARRNAGLVR